MWNYPALGWPSSSMLSHRALQALSALVPPNELPVGAELRTGGVLVSSLAPWAGANHGWTLDRLVCNIIDSQLFELFSDPEDGELLMATVSVPSPGPVAVIECDCDWVVAESAGPAPAVPGAMMPVGRAAAVAVPRVAQGRHGHGRGRSCGRGRGRRGGPPPPLPHLVCRSLVRLRHELPRGAECRPGGFLASSLTGWAASRQWSMEEVIQAIIDAQNHRVEIVADPDDGELLILVHPRWQRQR